MQNQQNVEHNLNEPLLQNLDILLSKNKLKKIFFLDLNVSNLVEFIELSVTNMP